MDSLKQNQGVAKLLQDNINQSDFKVASLIRERDKLREDLYNITENVKDKSHQLLIGLQYRFIDHIREYNEYILKLQRLFCFYQALKIQVYTPEKKIGDLLSEKITLLAKYLNGILPKETNLDSIKSFELTYIFHSVLTEIKKVVSKLNDDYTKFVFNKGTSEDEKKLAVNMKSVIDWLSEEKKKISGSIMDNIISNTTLLYNSINNGMFTQNFIIDNIKDKTDYVQFVFEATPKLQNQTSIFPKPISYKITMPIMDGMQMNVSSGVFFNIGLGNEEWYYKPTNKPDTFQITKASYKFGDLFRPSIGLLLQVYKRSPYADRFAGCFGFSTNATEINYYIGGSWIFGKSQRFVISAGLVGGQKEVLKGGFGEGNVDKLVSKSFKENNPTLEVSKKFKVGAFFSLTFNLWGKSTKEFNFEGNGSKDAIN